MTEPTINYTEGDLKENADGTVNAIYTITLEDISADDAWHLGLAVMGVVAIYNTKNRMEAKEANDTA